MFASQMFASQVAHEAADEAVSLGTCEKHPFDEATGTCRTCKRNWCPDCLIHPFGARKPPFCMGCALVAAGIRR